MTEPLRITGLHAAKVERRADSLIVLETDEGQRSLSLAPDLMADLLGMIVESLGLLHIDATQTKVLPLTDGSGKLSVQFEVGPGIWLSLGCSPEDARGLYRALALALGIDKLTPLNGEEPGTAH